MSGADGDDTACQTHAGQFEITDHIKDLVTDDLILEPEGRASKPF